MRNGMATSSMGKDVVARATAKRAGVRRTLLAWFGRRARDLPWRRTKDPYRIWLSEIMLQQTQVETGIPYYTRFVQALPDVHALAAADEQDVLRLWEGLGYYRRARHLHQAAKVVVETLDGRLPTTSEQWQQLPGVGRYTACAIASIAFGEVVAVVDGNVKRVLARLLAVRQCVDDASTTDVLWQAAAALVSPTRPGAFNEALMELGATVCRPKQPNCDTCPVRRVCDARKDGCQADLPVRRLRKAVPHHQIVVAVIDKRGRFLIGQRPGDAMLGRLWEFPGGKLEDGETHEAALRRELQEEVGIDIDVGDHLATVDHAYSHFKVTLHVYRCRHTGGKPQPRYHVALKWVPRSQLGQYPFPTANRKFLDRV